jgi:antitoxin component of MazEF toxin-antitoxin module
VQEIDLFDFIAGQMQQLALADGDDLQMGLEQRIIPRPQRRQETIASMLVLI